MRWKGRERSENVEDRRGMSPAAAAGGGGILVLVVAAVMFFMGNPQGAQQLLQQQAQQKQQTADPGQVPGEDDEYREFVSVVLNDTEEVWDRIFAEELNARYEQPELIMYSGKTNSGCGMADSRMGPFYCPADQKVYLDPAFFTELAQRHQSPGDFAAAYVIAHEVSHHIQFLTGFTNKVNDVRKRGNEIESNRMSVRLELQADYLAGVWAHHAHKEYQILEEGDIEEGIRAANAIGDDTLMKQAGSRAIPERYTHGTSEQRVYWFSKGLKSGKFRDCEELFQIRYEQL